MLLKDLLKVISEEEVCLQIYNNFRKCLYDNTELVDEEVPEIDYSLKMCEVDYIFGGIERVKEDNAIPSYYNAIYIYLK